MDPCKLKVKAFGCAFGLIWGISVLGVGIANITWPGYGQALLDFAASIYPGYDAIPTYGSVGVGTLYALLDGFIGGVILAWLYNLCAGKCKQEEKKVD